MNGFLATFGGDQLDLTSTTEGHPAGALVERSSGVGYSAARATLPTFIGDKPFGEADGLFVALEGVVMNARALLAKDGVGDLGKLCRKLFQRDGDQFHSVFEGDYSGIVYDVKAKRGIAFTNRTGTRPLFYGSYAGSIVIGASVGAVHKVLRAAGAPLGWDESAAYCLLSCGGMLDDETLIDGIKRLQPGCSLSLDTSKAVVRVDRYHQFSNEPDSSLSEDDAIEGLEERFSRAVKLGYEKDLEGGYAHIGSMSGGLDSRMTIFMARKLGYDTTLINLGHHRCDDQRIALQIAHELKFELLYYHLAQGNFLTDGTAKAMAANGGQVLGYGAAHVLKCYERINFDGFGLLHTGQIGDAIAGGSFLKREVHAAADPRQGFYSLRLYERVRERAERLAASYANEEMYKLYVRAFQVANNGYVITDRFLPAWSPFLETEFLEFAYRIPPELRFRSKIYHRWIKRHHPDAARYHWAAIAGPLRDWNFNVRGRRLSKWKSMIAKRLKKALGLPYDHMLGTNPFDYWLRTNRDLREDLQQQWQTLSGVASGLGVDAEVLAECAGLFAEGGCQEKLQGISLLLAFSELS